MDNKHICHRMELGRGDTRTQTMAAANVCVQTVVITIGTPVPWLCQDIMQCFASVLDTGLIFPTQDVSNCSEHAYIA